jgi:hypothetical protein
VLRTIAGSKREDCRRRLPPKLDAVFLGASIPDLVEVLGKQFVEACPLRREGRRQRVVRRLCDGGVHRCAFARALEAGVAPEAAGDRVDRVEDRDVDDRHRLARSSGAELFAEDAALAGRDRSVIQPAGVDRNLVPVAEPNHCVFSARARPPRQRAGLRRGPVARPPRFIGAAGTLLRPNGAGQAQNENRQCWKHLFPVLFDDLEN